LREYRWSSYRAYAGYEPAPAWLETGELLRRAHRQAARRREQFRADVQERLTHGVEPGRIERLRDAVAVGSAEFGRRVRALAAGKSLRGISGKQALRRRMSWPEVRAAVERLKGQPWDRFAERHGDDGRDVFRWAARRFCGVTVSEWARAVGAEYAAASAARRRFERKAACQRTLQDMQNRLTKMLNVAP
jgi:hypothetical protein